MLGALTTHRPESTPKVRGTGFATPSHRADGRIGDGGAPQGPPVTAEEGSAPPAAAADAAVVPAHLPGVRILRRV